MTPPRNSNAARDIANVLHPYTDAKAHMVNGPLVVSRGKGVRIYDDQGKEYIEALAGLWCASLGFDNERLVQAAANQMRKLPFYHSFTAKSHEPMIDLAEMLIERAPAPMSKVFFGNSGSEANDSAIKMIWYMNNALGRPKKKKLFSRLKGYHGITLAAASLTGLPANHKLFDAPIAGGRFCHVGTPHHYHNARPGESEGDFATRLAEELEARIIEEGGAEECAALWAGPVMGAGGVIVPPRTYFEKVQAVLKKYDMLFVADEVICGFGRTGAYWGSQTFNIQPDILVCAKALSSAYLPISAGMANEAGVQGIAGGRNTGRPWGQGFPHSGHPVSAAVAIETLKIYDETGTVAHAAEVGAHMQAELRRRFTDHPIVGEVRGVGLIGAIELSADKAARKPFDPAKKAGPRLVKHGEEQGVILRAMVNDSMGFSPPLVITRDEVNEMLDRVGKALDALAVELRRESIAAV